MKLCVELLAWLKTILEKQKTHLIVEAREGLRVEEAVVSAVVDPGVVCHAHDVC